MSKPTSMCVGIYISFSFKDKGNLKSECKTKSICFVVVFYYMQQLSLNYIWKLEIFYTLHVLKKIEILNNYT